MKEGYHLIAHADDQQAHPPEEPPGEVGLHPVGEPRKDHPAQQGCSKQQAQRDGQAQTQGGEAQAETGRGRPLGPREGEPPGRENDGEAQTGGRRPGLQQRRTAAQEASGHQSAPQAQQEVGPGGDQPHPGHRGPGDHRQHLQ